MRADGTRTPAEKRKALAAIEAQITAVDAALAALAAHTNHQPLAPVHETVGTAWNTLHDAVDALRAEHREIDLNRRTVLTHSDVLVMENRD